MNTIQNYGVKNNYQVQFQGRGVKIDINDPINCFRSIISKPERLRSNYEKKWLRDAIVALLGYRF